jgi:hypothetical protein
MRCKACNALMTDADCRRKDKETGEYLDLCGACFYASEDAIHGFYGSMEVPLGPLDLDPWVTEED